jgi:hypothetical protein
VCVHFSVWAAGVLNQLLRHNGFERFRSTDLPDVRQNPSCGCRGHHMFLYTQVPYDHVRRTGAYTLDCRSVIEGYMLICIIWVYQNAFPATNEPNCYGRSVLSEPVSWPIQPPWHTKRMVRIHDNITRVVLTITYFPCWVTTLTWTCCGIVAVKGAPTKLWLDRTGCPYQNCAVLSYKWCWIISERENSIVTSLIC